MNDDQKRRLEEVLRPKAKPGSVRLDEYGYPEDWPKCPGCGLPVMDGHATCGDASCRGASDLP